MTSETRDELIAEARALEQMAYSETPRHFRVDDSGEVYLAMRDLVFRLADALSLSAPAGGDLREKIAAHIIANAAGIAPERVDADTAKSLTSFPWADRAFAHADSILALIPSPDRDAIIEECAKVADIYAQELQISADNYAALGDADLHVARKCEGRSVAMQVAFSLRALKSGDAT